MPWQIVATVIESSNTSAVSLDSLLNDRPKFPHRDIPVTKDIAELF